MHAQYSARLRCPWTPQICPKTLRMRSRAPAGENRLGCSKPRECPLLHIKLSAASLQHYCMSVDLGQPLERGPYNCRTC